MTAAPASPFASLADEERALLRAAPAPAHADTMKAVLTDARFNDDNWIFERKLDGVRCVAVRDGGAARLLSRNDLSLNGRYPEIATALEGQPQRRFAVDGEVVAFDGAQTSFARLARRGQAPVPVFYYIFDVVWLDGQDVRDLPLRTRKRLLRDALTFDDKALRFSTHRNRDGERYFEEACRKGWEGLVAKRADSRYTNKRSKDWLKLKCEQGQELVVGGYTAPKGSRTDFGALLLGYYDGDGALRYAGKVGTGFDDATLAALGARLRGLRTDAPPFADASAIRERTATWVRPVVVAQLGFSEWTSAGRLRHPKFLGLRDDKAARDVVRERP
ncbi:Multifunctional non-homologous end joining protein LigD [Baekduia alba]|uniref:non-homologous end-joining DNA ligase n=1 Tax=Baekduia alba TaxID=2997333 RepID=UPI0023426462|nr:non-homologous end-joining DNA ligase [Baekduia alba]WCB94739.1 Multifunctional non-homologous end joining protein LigD [Baekduia alba]